jgi:molybdenum cofactor cytidylyltransferase
MKFGPVPIAEACGAISAHAVRVGEARLKKGQIVGPAEQAALQTAGVQTIIAAELEPGDVSEDEAALRLAQAIAGRDLTLGAVDDAITVATLPEYRPVVAGDMAATVKIIPFATSIHALDAACLAAGEAAVSVAPYRPLRFAVVSTLLPGLKPSVVNKTLGVLEARLSPARARIVEDRRTPHEIGSLAEMLITLAEVCDVLVVFGASAITDRRDVVPAAIERAGGEIEHFGMPVDPGNLLLLGKLAGRPIIGAPGCARSPKENGFDWVLGRVLADIPVTRADIQAMGVGGLLMEIESRPQPRQSDG